MTHDAGIMTIKCLFDDLNLIVRKFRLMSSWSIFLPQIYRVDFKLVLLLFSTYEHTELPLSRQNNGKLMCERVWNKRVRMTISPLSCKDLSSDMPPKAVQHQTSYISLIAQTHCTSFNQHSFPFRSPNFTLSAYILTNTLPPQIDTPRFILALVNELDLNAESLL